MSSSRPYQNLWLKLTAHTNDDLDSLSHPPDMAHVAGAIAIGLTTAWGLGSNLAPALAQANSLSLMQADRVELLAQRPDSMAQTLLFVHPTLGNDQSDGSQRSPFRTITHALQLAQPNTIILLATGTYSTDTGEAFPLALKPGVTLQGDPSTQGRGIVIRGGGPLAQAPNRSVTMVGADRASLMGVTVLNPTLGGYGVWLESAQMTVTHNTFRTTAERAIAVATNNASTLNGNIYSTEAPASSVATTPPPPTAPIAPLPPRPVAAPLTHSPSSGFGQLPQLRPATPATPPAIPITITPPAPQPAATPTVAIAPRGIPVPTSARASASAPPTLRSSRSLPAVPAPRVISNQAPPRQAPVAIPVIPPASRQPTPASSSPTVPITVLPPARPVASALPPVQPTPAVAIPIAVTPAPRPEPARTVAPAPNLNLLPVPDGGAPVGNVAGLPTVPVPRYAAQPVAGTLISSNSVARLGLRYRVVVEADDEYLQNELRSLIPGAFRTSLNGRVVMQAGAFSDRINADEIVARLNRSGFRAVVQSLE